MNPIPCSICNEGGHHSRRCPQLTAPLQPGFYAPSGGGRYTGDDEDEKLNRFIMSSRKDQLKSFAHFCLNNSRKEKVNGGSYLLLTRNI